ncbi:MAG TPA: exonuclease SbcCD subunit D [Vicinamibacteria bacterium]|nr:exonuclease SbcCD subunit D [Vicinamibacteria bacterium]
MRFLHTADWHVGKPLRGRSRMDEYARALGQVAGIAVDRKVDAVLIAGDVFDSPAPPPEAEKLVYDFLARLVSERIACVLIAGNHDHPKKLGALASLLEGLRIHVRPEVRPPDQGGVVSLASRDGKEEARIAVLPFVPERRVVDACTVMDAEHKWYEAYSKRIEQILAALVMGLPATTVNIALAHLLVDGARVGTGERELHLGSVYGVNPQQLPSTVQYIALGHLHRPQEVLAPAKTRYPGSLVELDFGEQDQEKSVVVLDAQPQRPPDIELVEVTAGRRLRTVEGTLDDLQRLAEERSDDYLRVRVKAEAPTPGLADRVKELLPNALDVTVDHPRDASAQPERGKGRGKLAPAQLFAAYYEHRNQAPPPAELQKLFDAIHDEAAS